MAGQQCSVDGCEKPKVARTWCWMHYNRWRRYGDLNYQCRVIHGSADERFWPKVEKNGPANTELGPCWIWAASKNRDGYGLFFNGSKAVGAHRWAYENQFGPISKGLELDHLCRNRSCVNPSHLEPVSSLENTKRSPIHYGARTHCKHGHEYTPENTISRKDGGRRCRTCKNEYIRRSRKSSASS